MIRLRALVLLAILLAAGAVPAAAAPPYQAGEGETPTATWETVLARTAELRGLPVPAEVPHTVLTRQQLRARVDEQLAREGVAEELAATARLYVALGLLDPGDDLAGLVAQRRCQDVDGFYDPRT